MLRLCSRLAGSKRACARLLRLQSTTSADVDAANQELDEFFGMANTAATVGPSTEPHPVMLHHTTAAHHQPHTGQVYSGPRVPQVDPAASHSTEPRHVGALESVMDALSSAGDASLTHTDAYGRASMVDVAQKPASERVAKASAVVHLGEVAFRLVQENNIKKGDVLTVAQLAGIMGAKSTANLIPLCHPVALTKADVQLSLQPADHSIRIRSMAKTVGQTGVEMEALTAAAVAALTVYDMCKAVSKGITISKLRLDFKSGGKSGVFKR